jgi:hypothetical protein
VGQKRLAALAGLLDHVVGSVCSVAGTLIFNLRAVLRLITNSKVVGCLTCEIIRLIALENTTRVDSDLALCIGGLGRNMELR